MSHDVDELQLGRPGSVHHHDRTLPPHGDGDGQDGDEYPVPVPGKILGLGTAWGVPNQI